MKKIFIVDDEKDFCYFTKKNLEESGDFEVTTCVGSDGAMETARRLKPDIVLLDIMMPGTSGVELAMKLRSDKSTKHIPCVFLSSLINETGMGKYKELVGDGHIIPKPVKIKELMAVIDKVLTEVQTAGGGIKNKIRTVTFLSRQQIDFLDKLGNDAMFHHGSKLSRAQILSEMVTFLMESGINIKEVNLKETTLSKGVAKLIKK